MSRLVARLMELKDSQKSLMIAVVGILILIYIPFSYYAKFVQDRKQLEDMQDGQIQLIAAAAPTLYSSGMMENLNSILEAEIRLRNLSYFVFYKDGKAILSYPRDEILAYGNSFDERKRVLGIHLSDDVRSELTKQLDVGVYLTVGRKQQFRSSMTAVIFGTDLWKSVAVLYIMILALFGRAYAAILRDVSALAQTIRKTGRISN